MKIAIHTDNLERLREAVGGDSACIRFGSEFCEHLLPGQDELKEAYDRVRSAGKEFVYVTPRLSNAGIDKVRKQLAFLNKKGRIRVVFNDLGTLNMLRRFPNLRPQLGRLLLRVPARSPFAERIAREGFAMGRERSAGDTLSRGSAVAKEWYAALFSYTSLSYSPTIEFFKSYGVRNVDVDWLPRTFVRFDALMKRDLELSVYLHLVPIMVTRKCHLARFLGEERPEECSKPCLEDSLIIKSELAGVQLLLQGNAVLAVVQPADKDLESLREIDVAEVVVVHRKKKGQVS